MAKDEASWASNCYNLVWIGPLIHFLLYLHSANSIVPDLFLWGNRSQMSVRFSEKLRIASLSLDWRSSIRWEIDQAFVDWLSMRDWAFKSRD
jgi:hypothetical protein